jgi:hypothetical protein
VALAVALLASAAAHAEFRDDYALGLRAIDEGKYADARMYLERALAAQGEPVSKIILNGNIEQPYLPYHFLGMAAYKQGDCAGAKQAWENPMNRRMLGRLFQLEREERRLASGCKPKAQVAAKEPEPAPPPSPAPEPAPEPVAPPTEPAPPAKPPPREAPKPATVEKTPATPPEKPESERAPPSRLVRALDSFLAGKYVDAARIDPAALSGNRARFQGYLVRAAARFTEAEISGDKELLAGARADAAAAHAIDATTQPDEIVFSPKFRAFYRQAP